MKLKECISAAVVALNLGDISGEPTERDKLLIQCANNCLDEIACEYLPLYETKEVASTGGEIPYAKLGVSVLDVVSVKGAKGEVDFRLLPSCVKVEKDDTYTVVFCTRPGELGYEDEVPFPVGLTPRIVSYGICAEYLLSTGFYEEAVTYDKRFKDALARMESGRSEKRVKGRRWLL